LKFFQKIQKKNLQRISRNFKKNSSKFSRFIKGKISKISNEIFEKIKIFKRISQNLLKKFQIN
jgi:hypothetical protein